MKITKQIDERRFEVVIEDSDLIDEKKVIVAHDYVKFVGNSGLGTTDISVKLHTINTCANYIPLQHMVSFPIRDMIELIIPHLSKHPLCTKERIEGKYLTKGDPIHFWENGVHMISLRDELDVMPTILPYEVYSKIRNGEL